MEIKAHIANLERMIGQNPAIIALIVAIFLAGIFISVVLFDSYMRRRRQHVRHHKRGK